MLRSRVKRRLGEIVHLSRYLFCCLCVWSCFRRGFCSFGSISASSAVTVVVVVAEAEAAVVVVDVPVVVVVAGIDYCCSWEGFVLELNVREDDTRDLTLQYCGRFRCVYLGCIYSCDHAWVPGDNQ